ncbi:hypothetical protein L6164_029862 [Bauhinia variegata]|uniref:Uncharacterized protein n=1 Tax=Bauhinia variegata TaxID=167791 RepID=A0ACB9LAY7_BAUVA|nr:hypothetical protein L6164_029862 [Bauhinia variegata]
MGGCASRPKDSDFKSEAAPSELPASPKKAGGEDKHVAQENTNEGWEGEKKEEPLVNLSEPKEEKKEESSEPAAPVAEAEKTKEENVAAKPEEKEAEAPEKEEAKPEEPKAAPSSEDKTDARLVTL